MTALVMSALDIAGNWGAGRVVTTAGPRRYLEVTFVSDPRHARLFSCRDAEGTLISAAMAYEWRDSLYMRATGTAYDAVPPRAFTYFNVMYYEPMEYAAQRGLSKIYFGIGSLGAKISRGCRTDILSHALLCD